MRRVLLADDSPHAQRMGERILRDEGWEVVTVSDGKTAMLRLEDSAPDVIVADISMPEVSGLELCDYVKRRGQTAVILTAGPVEAVDEREVTRVRADGLLRKPFEASLLLGELARFAGRHMPGGDMPAPAARSARADARSVAVVDAETIRAAVTLALDEALPSLIDRIAESVTAALK